MIEVLAFKQTGIVLIAVGSLVYLLTGLVLQIVRHLLNLREIRIEAEVYNR